MPDLLIVGGPTHMHGLATKRNRHVAAMAAQEDGRSHLEAGTTIEPGLRMWLGDLSPGAAHHAAAFDTRLDKSPLISGAAARGIARRLSRLGIDVVAAESFLVEDTEGPPKAGELERARALGRRTGPLDSDVKEATRRDLMHDGSVIHRLADCQ